MGISYLGGKTWLELTREERFFTAILFMELRKNCKPFVNLLRGIDNHFDNFIYEPAFEVCLYRDMLNDVKSQPKERFSLKRTFDLVLFSETEMIIIEAKANQSFTRTQLSSISRDKKQIISLFSAIQRPYPDVKMCAICSSKYNPGEETRKHFELLITWMDLVKIYPDSSNVFKLADDCYRN